MADLKDIERSLLKREVDSVDDFEHLGHDSSPLKERNTADLLSGFKTGTSDTVRDIHNEIDKRVENVSRSVTDMFDPLADVPAEMDSMGDRFKETGDQVEKFLDDFKPKMTKVGLDKTSIQSFVDRERAFLHDLPQPAKANVLDRYSDSEPELDDFKPSIDDTFPRKDLPQAFSTGKTDTFKDLDDFLQGSPKKQDAIQKPKIPEPVFQSESLFETAPVSKPEPAIKPQPLIREPVKPKTPEPLKEPFKTVHEPVKKQPEPVKMDQVKKEPVKIEEKPKIAPADTGAIFRKMGIGAMADDLKKVASDLVDDVLNGVSNEFGGCTRKGSSGKACERSLLCVLFSPNAWFNPERLNPKVESLIYWRDPKKSGPVFGGVLVVLLALTYFSLISVVAYLSLITLTGTIAFRIYKNIVQAVQKTGDGHPFKDVLDLDVSLPQDKVREIVDVAIAHLNAAIVELRRLFLVEDLVDSIKFGVLLWVLTYLGSWFNGMTLIIIAWVALFSLPKVYETNKTQIDANLALVRSKLADITTKVKAAIPIGKKGEAKKEQ